MKTYDFNAIKAVYDKADKNFNPKNHKMDNKDPSPQVFTSKVYFKFLSMNNKTISKALKTANPEYYKLLEDTNGDYSRRKGGHIAEQIKAHVDWAKELVRTYPNLKYSILGTFVDVYSILSDLRWRAAFKLAFDFCRKNGDNRTIAAAIKSLYFAMVISCETTVLKLVELEYMISLGNTPENAVLQLQTRYAVFMKKSIVPSINLFVLLKNINDPTSYVKSVINGETKAKKSTENFTVPMYKDKATKSMEGAFFDTMKAAGGAIANIAASGLAAVGGFVAAASTTAAGSSSAVGFAGAAAGAGNLVTGGILATGASATAGGAAFIVGVIGTLWFIFTIIPSIRIILYYAAISKVNVQKELALHEEMLSNNIAALKEKYDNMKAGEAKDKLGAVIEKQQKMYEDLLAKIKNMSSDNYNDDTAVDNALSTDESESDKEADKAGTDTNADGDVEDVGDGFSVLI